MALTEKMIELFRKNIKDPKLSDEDKKRFKDALDKEGVSYSASETEIVEEEVKTPKPTKAKKKKSKKKTTKKISSDDLAQAKADLKAKTGKTEKECEDIISQYKALREKAKVGRAKRTSKLKKEGKLIKGTDVKDAGATIDTAKKKVEEKIKTELKKVEKKEEAKVKSEVKKEKEKQAKTEKPKAKQDKEVKKVEKKEEKKAEKEVKEKTEKVAVKLVIDTTEMINAITKALSTFDKNSSKEYLKQLRDDIDKLLANYDAGGFTQTLNITQSNMSASSVNPSQFKKGGDVEFFGQKFMAKGGKIKTKTKDVIIEKTHNLFNGKPTTHKITYEVMTTPTGDWTDTYNFHIEKRDVVIKSEDKERIGDSVLSSTNTTFLSPKKALKLFDSINEKNVEKMFKSKELNPNRYARGGDIEFFGQKFMAKGGRASISKEEREKMEKIVKGYADEMGAKYVNEYDNSLTEKQKNEIKSRFLKEHPKFAKELGIKKMKRGGDIEFFGQKFKKKGGIVDKFTDAYNDLVKELGFKKRGGDIEFFGTKYKKKGGVVDKFNKAYKDLVKELGFKRGGDIQFFGQDYKRMGGKIRKYKQGYNDRDDESLAMRRRRHKSQDYRARRNESKGELKHKMRRAYSDVDSMDRGNRYLKRGGDVEFFGQKFKKRGGDVDFFGQKYKADGGQIDFDSVVDTGQPHEMMRMGGKTKNKNWIQSVVDSPNFRKGAFTRKAKERGMSTEAFMKQVLSNPNRYDLRTRRQAQFMKNI